MARTHFSRNQQKSKSSVHKNNQKKLLSSQPIAFRINNLSHEGRGVALYDEANSQNAAQIGKKAFVRFALPDEKVVARITKSNTRYDEAEMIDVIENPSLHRVEPVCQHFGRCGGCALQHIALDEQIRFKQQVLASHLQHFAGLEPDEWLPPIRNAKQDYRRRARLGVRWREKEQKLVIGFREVASNFLIDIQECAILDQRVAWHLLELKQTLNQLQIKQHIGHLEFALGDDDVALIIRLLKALPKADEQRLLALVQKYDWQLYIQYDENLSVSNAKGLHRIDAKDAKMRVHYALPSFQLNLAFAPMDFTQVNAEVNRQMVQLACDLLQLQQGEKVLDLFCGLGNFSLPLARCVGELGQVVAVEGVDEMVHRGAENAQLNQLKNVAFYCQDLTQDFSSQGWAKQGFDAILIDPPRAGAEQVMQYIDQFGAKRIVYVSCNPATLARDSAILVQKGYRLSKAGVMDMFSHTEHVESIALFEQACVETDVAELL